MDMHAQALAIVEPAFYPAPFEPEPRTPSPDSPENLANKWDLWLAIEPKLKYFLRRKCPRDWEDVLSKVMLIFVEKFNGCPTRQSAHTYARSVVTTAIREELRIPRRSKAAKHLKVVSTPQDVIDGKAPRLYSEIALDEYEESGGVLVDKDFNPEEACLAAEEKQEAIALYGRLLEAADPKVRAALEIMLVGLKTGESVPTWKEVAAEVGMSAPKLSDEIYFLTRQFGRKAKLRIRKPGTLVVAEPTPVIPAAEESGQFLLDLPIQQSGQKAQLLRLIKGRKNSAVKPEQLSLFDTAEPTAPSQLESPAKTCTPETPQRPPLRLAHSTPTTICSIPAAASIGSGQGNRLYLVQPKVTHDRHLRLIPLSLNPESHAPPGEPGRAPPK